MRKYLIDLGYTTGVAFLTPLVALAAADKPFNALTFDWGTSLTVAGSSAVLALLHGLLAGLQGDRSRARFTKRP